jgi:flagellar biosynthesis/type III secretory pathway ATPase
VLTRKLATAGHYPAIDVLDSKSRVRDHLLDAAERQAANRLLRAEAAYREKEDLIMVGAYQKGSDPYVDAAVQLRDQMLGFVQQRPDESTPYDETRGRLAALSGRIEAATTRRSA